MRDLRHILAAQARNQVPCFAVPASPITRGSRSTTTRPRRDASPTAPRSTGLQVLCQSWALLDEPVRAQTGLVRFPAERRADLDPSRQWSCRRATSLVGAPNHGPRGAHISAPEPRCALVELCYSPEQLHIGWHRILCALPRGASPDGAEGCVVVALSSTLGITPVPRSAVEACAPVGAVALTLARLSHRTSLALPEG